MPGQTWPAAAASFLGNVGRDDGGDDAAVLGPNAVDATARPSAETGETRLGPLTALVGVGYFFVWTVFGMAAFPLGVSLAAVEMQQPALARRRSDRGRRGRPHCRRAPVQRVEGASPCLLPGGSGGSGRTLRADAGTAWRHGLRLGAHCSYGCAGLTSILLVIGVMDLGAMAVVTASHHRRTCCTGR